MNPLVLGPLIALLAKHVLAAVSEAAEDSQLPPGVAANIFTIASIVQQLASMHSSAEAKQAEADLEAIVGRMKTSQAELRESADALRERLRQP